MWSYFFKERIDFPDKANELMKKLKANIQVKKIQYDNAGENCA